MNFRFKKYVAPACLFLITRHADRARRGFPACFRLLPKFPRILGRSPESRTQAFYPQFNGAISTDCNRGWEGVDSIRRGAVEFASYKFIVLHSAPAW